MEVMNRSEFIREISERAKLEVEDVQRMIEASEDILMEKRIIDKGIFL